MGLIYEIFISRKHSISGDLITVTGLSMIITKIIGIVEIANEMHYQIITNFITSKCISNWIVPILTKIQQLSYIYFTISLIYFSTAA